jgi:hypothetical protein
MTDSAKRAFLNALVYMQRFDGARPLVKKDARSRAWLQQYVAMAGKLDEMKESSRDSYQRSLTRVFPASVIEEHGLDAEALERWRVANVEFMGANFVIDADLASLGVSNRTPAFLDLLEQRLSADPRDDLALRLARRYLPPDSVGVGIEGAAAAALTWVRAHRADAFFSDVGGYRWYAGPPATTSGAATGRSAGQAASVR